MVATYVDTSAPMALACHTPQYEQAQQWPSICQQQSLPISPWVQARLASAPSSKQRTQQTNAAQMQQPLTQGCAFLANIPSADTSSAGHENAQSLRTDAKARLRNADAFHLTVATRNSCAALTRFDADRQATARNPDLACPFCLPSVCCPTRTPHTFSQTA